VAIAVVLPEYGIFGGIISFVTRLEGDLNVTKNAFPWGFGRVCAAIWLRYD
jgi:hypothetical protein